jgi:hypothetical protein
MINNMKVSPRLIGIIFLAFGLYCIISYVKGSNKTHISKENQFEVKNSSPDTSENQ